MYRLIKEKFSQIIADKIIDCCTTLFIRREKKTMKRKILFANIKRLSYPEFQWEKYYMYGNELFLYHHHEDLFYYSRTRVFNIKLMYFRWIFMLGSIPKSKKEHKFPSRNYIYVLHRNIYEIETLYKNKLESKKRKYAKYFKSILVPGCSAKALCVFAKNFFI